MAQQIVWVEFDCLFSPYSPLPSSLSPLPPPLGHSGPIVHSRTQVHISSFGPVGAGHVLEDGIEDLLLDLGDGVTVQDLHRDLRAVHVVRVHAAQDLRKKPP